ncbi:MAG: hypothetical protein ACXVWZ_06350 [Nocardioides sp.]
MMTTHGLRDHLAQAPAVRLFTVFWGGLATIDVARAGELPGAVQVALLAALAAACAVAQPAGTAAALGLVAWLVVLGFVVHDDGSLTGAGPADAARLVVLVALPVLVAGSTR